MSELREWLLVGAAIGGSLLGAMGLATWRKELKGREDHELAKSVLRSLLRVRDTFLHLRSRLIAAAEAESGDTSGVFLARWGRFMSALGELETAVNEAVVLWGESYRALMLPVREAGVDLEFSLSEFLDTRDDTFVSRQRKSRAAQEFFGSGHQGDIIGTKLTTALAALETAARTKLAR